MTTANLPAEPSLQISGVTRRKATAMAKLDGVSLKDFVILAVAEKLAREESVEFARYKQETCHH